MDHVADLSDLGVRRDRTQLSGSKVQGPAPKWFERQRTEINRATKPEIHQAEILGDIHFDRESDSDEFARGVEDLLRYTLLANSVAPVVAQLDLRRRICPDLRQQRKLRRTPADLRYKNQRTRNREERDEGAGQSRLHRLTSSPGVPKAHPSTSNPSGPDFVADGTQT